MLHVRHVLWNTNKSRIFVLTFISLARFSYCIRSRSPVFVLYSHQIELHSHSLGGNFWKTRKTITWTRRIPGIDRKIFVVLIVCTTKFLEFRTNVEDWLWLCARVQCKCRANVYEDLQIVLKTIAEFSDLLRWRKRAYD